MADSLIVWSMRTLLIALLIAGKPWRFPAHGQFLFEEAATPADHSLHLPKALRHESSPELPRSELTVSGALKIPIATKSP